MEYKKKKCSNKEHKDNDALYFCQNCKLYICKKCLSHHKELFDDHIVQNLDNNKEIFIDLCKEVNHPMKFEFFCKTHNQLCCVCCVSKIKVNGYGQHKDCNVCAIQDIKEEKKNKLKENIKYLEDLSSNLNDSIKELKILYDKIEEKKEQLKLKIQNIFTKLKTALNEREDKLLLEVDNKLNKLFDNANIIKESEKLPNKIRLSIEKVNSLSNEWDDNNKLSSLIANCNEIEENIKNISIINNIIQKNKINKDINIDLDLGDEYYENFIKNINLFGKIYIKSKSSIDSIIIEDKYELDKFYNLLSSQIKIRNMKLLYRASKDGFGLKNIKSKINNKSNLIFLFSTGNKRIFGLFVEAEIKITKYDSYIDDAKALVFSLNNHKIYKNLIPNSALRFWEGNKISVLIGNTKNSNGFFFSHQAEIINDEGLLNNPKVYDFQKKNELTNGDNKFNELEVFEMYSD